MSHNFKNILEQSFYYGQSTVDSYKLSSDSRYIVSSYNIEKRWGEIKAFKLLPSGDEITLAPIWNKGGQDGKADRKRILLSYNSEQRKGVRLPSSKAPADLLSDDQLQLLFPVQNNSRGQSVAIEGEEIQVLDENIADDKTKEDRVALLRNFLSDLHKKPLGTIVNSNLLVAENPQVRAHSTESNAIHKRYNEYARTVSRPAVLYANSNDGMLHGFHADTGQELFGYVPSQVLTDGLVKHDLLAYQSFVDGELTVADAYFSRAKQWRTVVVGGLRYGGKGYYALDVTKPDKMTAKQVLWELDSLKDKDIGYSFSRPSVGLFASGQSLAVVGNGLNSEGGHAALYFINLETGDIVRKFRSPYGRAQDPTKQFRPNAFSEPALVDVDGDSVIDRVYVGDFFGNMFAFDVSNTNEKNWKSFFNGKNGPQPFVDSSVVHHTPITSRPAVISKYGTDNLTVVYGTGDLFTQNKGQGNDHVLIGAIHSQDNITSYNMLNKRVLEKKGDSWIIKTPEKIDQQVNGWYMPLVGTASSLMNTVKPLLNFGESIWILHEEKTDAGAVSCTTNPIRSHILALDPYTGLGFDIPIFRDENQQAIQVDDDNIDGVTVNNFMRDVNLVSLDGVGMLLGNTDTQFFMSINKSNVNKIEGRQSWFKY